MKKIFVVGSGVGGLAIAIRLAKRGYKVKVFEKNTSYGGKISQIHYKGFRWDTGPSLFTLPELATELFHLCEVNPSDFLKFQKIDPVCQYFYPDGTKFNAWADPVKFAGEMQKATGEPAFNTLAFLKKYEELYQVAAPVFLFNSFHKFKNFTKPEFRNTLFKLHKLDSLTTMWKRNNHWFQTRYVSQLFNRYATYNGSNPLKTPATLNMIAHLEHNLGGYIPEKGMFQIVDSLYQLALNQGVEFEFNAKVEKVFTHNKQVTAIQVNNRTEPTDGLVSDIDVRTFYHHLIQKKGLQNPKSDQKLSSSGIIFYWAMDLEFQDLHLHNIFFSENYKLEFQRLFNNKTIYSDPTVYLYISSKLVSGDAPKGSENWFVMVNAPADAGQDWDLLVKETRKSIIKKLEKHLNCSVENHIVFEQVANPLTIERQTGSWKGALYGNSSNGIFSAFNRHANFSRAYKNLYFTGGSVHPGGGIPLCLASAKIVDGLIPDPS